MYAVHVHAWCIYTCFHVSVPYIYVSVGNFEIVSMLCLYASKPPGIRQHTKYCIYIYIYIIYIYIIIYKYDVGDLIQKYGLDNNKVNTQCDYTHLLAKQIGEWEDIAGSLNLTKQEILAINKDGHTEGDRRKLMLNKWVTKNGRVATYHRLIEACISAEEMDAAERICEFIKDKL